jgi:hypothetical protein
MTGSSREVEGSRWLRIGARFRSPLLIRELPREVAFGFLERLLPLTERIDFGLEFHRIPNDQAIEMVHNARAVAEAELARGAGAATAPMESIGASSAELAGQIARREQDLFKVGIRFVAVDPTRDGAERLRAGLERRLHELGFRPRIPHHEVREALRPYELTGLEPRPAGYWHTLPTDGLAAFYPLGDEGVLERGGVLLGLTLGEAAPVVVDRWRHASYSWGIFGTTGAGKSFATALTLLRSRWQNPHLRIVILDPLGEFAGFAEAIGGSVIRLGRDARARLNPLDPVTTKGDRKEKAGRVGAILRALWPSLLDEETARLDAAVTRLYERGPAVPTMGDLVDEVASDGKAPPRLAGLLEVFRSGSLASVDGPTTIDPNSDLLVVDFRGIPENHLPFHLAYVLDWTYGQLRDAPGPKLAVVDEAHLLARHPATAEFLDRVVRHVRHYQGGFLLLSQSPDDFLRHESGRAILRNLRASLLLRLSSVSERVEEFYGLTSSEREWLPRARLPAEAGYSEGLLRLGEAHLPLAIVATTLELEFLTRSLGVPQPPPDNAASPPDGL